MVNVRIFKQHALNKYQQYTVEDFSLDLRFREWVFNPSEGESIFWEQWIKDNPTQQENIDQAILLINTFTIEKVNVSQNSVQKGIAEVNRRISLLEVPFYKKTIFRIAASIGVVFALSFWVFQNTKNKEKQLAFESQSKQVENTTEETISIELSDGSKVTLAANSTINYPEKFTGDTREISLRGEAFFEIEKDSLHPFLVFAGNTTTQVLGTSFTVRAFENEKKVAVNVLTGKVKVTTNDPKENKKGEQVKKIFQEVTLVPNQQAIFSELEMKLEKSLAKSPILLIPKSELKKFEFEETSVPKILETIERAYGVDIEFDADKLTNCALTTNLIDVPLYDKLTVICKSIGATYTIDGVTIKIQGSDCY